MSKKGRWGKKRKRQFESRSRDRSEMNRIKKGRRSDVNEDRGEKGIGRDIEPRRSEREDFAFVLPWRKSASRWRSASSGFSASSLRASSWFFKFPRFLLSSRPGLREYARRTAFEEKMTGERLCETVLPLAGQRRKLTPELPRFPVRSNSFSFAHLPPFPPLDSQKRAFSHKAFAPRVRYTLPYLKTKRNTRCGEISRYLMLLYFYLSE